MCIYVEELSKTRSVGRKTELLSEFVLFFLISKNQYSAHLSSKSLIDLKSTTNFDSILL